MSDLAKQLDVKAGLMEMGERIAWGSDTAIMRQAARTIEAKEKRIAELEAEVNEQARLLGESGSTEARLNTRIALLEAAAEEALDS